MFYSNSSPDSKIFSSLCSEASNLNANLTRGSEEERKKGREKTRQGGGFNNAFEKNEWKYEDSFKNCINRTVVLKGFIPNPSRPVPTVAEASRASAADQFAIVEFEGKSGKKAKRGAVRPPRPRVKRNQEATAARTKTRSKRPRQGKEQEKEEEKEEEKEQDEQEQDEDEAKMLEEVAKMLDEEKDEQKQQDDYEQAIRTLTPDEYEHASIAQLKTFVAIILQLQEEDVKTSLLERAVETLAKEEAAKQDESKDTVFRNILRDFALLTPDEELLSGFQCFSTPSSLSTRKVSGSRGKRFVGQLARGV